MGERLNHTIEKVKQNGRKVAALAAIGGVSLLAAGCASTETHSLKTATRIANDRYDHVYDNSSPVGKFVLEYLRRAYTDVSATRDDGDGVGINKMYRFQFNDGCLGGSAYDVAGGDFHIRVSAEADGFFSDAEANGSATGRVPAAAANAYVSDQHPDVLHIQSGHNGTAPLVFRGVSGNSGLVPVTQHTKNVLDTYGCDEGLQVHSTITGHYLQPHRQVFLK